MPNTEHHCVYLININGLTYEPIITERHKYTETGCLGQAACGLHSGHMYCVWS